MAEEPEAGSGLSDESVIDIKRNVQSFVQSRRWEQVSECTVFRVGLAQKTLNPEQYRPAMISLGLYDRTRFDVSDMPKTKGDTFRLTLVSAFLVDLGKTTEADWDDVCKTLVAKPKEIQKLYDEERDKDLPEEAVRNVLTLDAIFLLCFYCSAYWENFLLQFSSVSKVIRREHHNLTMFQVVCRDILKLENQVPFGLIRNVFKLAIQCGKSFPLVQQHLKEEAATHCQELPDQILDALCRDLLDDYQTLLPGYRFHEAIHSLEFDYKFHEAKHFLDCLHGAMIWDLKRKWRDEPQDATGLQHLLWSRLHLNRQKRQTTAMDVSELRTFYNFGEPLPTATQLQEAGIEFRGRRGVFTRVEFKVHMFKAVLYLPEITYMSDESEELWRNLIAYEAGTAHSAGTYDEYTGHFEFMAYLHLMDDLIETEKDVAMLKKGIHPTIGRNGLGIGSDKKVANLFNSMLKNYEDREESLRWKQLRREIREYYDNDARKSRVEFMRTYFGKWWLTVSILAATVLLILTFLQTVYAMVSFYKTP